ncbi:hypothetical protein JCM10212_002154 [Sporobolomyces blumeae]
MQLSLVLLIASAFHLAAALPTPNLAQRDINISTKSLVSGATATHSIDASVLPAELAQALEGSDININLTTDRRKRSPVPASGVNNSTINLTVIGSRSLPSRKQLADEARARRAKRQHHNIHIDASSNGQGGVGGIHNSTVNINLNASKKERRRVELGDHSVVVDVSASSSTSSESTGIEDSTVHVNILPPRALEKSTGHHSIVVDSSSFDSDDSTSTSTGSHSAVVDTSSSSSGSNGTGIKGSTINLTVISPSDDASTASTSSTTPSTDEVDAPIPSMARLTRRSAEAFEAWSSRVRSTSIKYLSETDQLAANAEADAGLALIGRNHASHKA